MALGVGPVISGDFFGWNLGLDGGGFGGRAAASATMGGGYVSPHFRHTTVGDKSTRLR